MTTQNDDDKLNVNFKFTEALPRGQNNTGVYTITHDATEKVYHGATKNIRQRMTEHKTDLNNKYHRNMKLQDVAVEDPNFTVSFEPTATKEEALVIEQERIDNTDPEKLLNLCLDTTNFVAGLWKNPEIRERISNSRIGNKNNANRVWTKDQKMAASERMKGNTHLKGHIHSEESRKKMSESGKLKPKRSPESYTRSPETSAAQGETMTKYRVIVGDKTYKNLRAASEDINLSPNAIYKRCLSERFPDFSRVPK